MMVWGFLDPFIFEALRKVPAALYSCTSAGAPSGIRGNETAVSLSYLGRKEKALGTRRGRGHRTRRFTVEDTAVLYVVVPTETAVTAPEDWLISLFIRLPLRSSRWRFIFGEQGVCVSVRLKHHAMLFRQFHGNGAARGSKTLPALSPKTTHRSNAVHTKVCIWFKLKRREYQNHAHFLVNSSLKNVKLQRVSLCWRQLLPITLKLKRCKCALNIVLMDAWENHIFSWKPSRENKERLSSLLNKSGQFYGMIRLCFPIYSDSRTW